MRLNVPIVPRPFIPEFDHRDTKTAMVLVDMHLVDMDHHRLEDLETCLRLLLMVVGLLLMVVDTDRRKVVVAVFLVVDRREPWELLLVEACLLFHILVR